MSLSEKDSIIVIALGGNAILRPNEAGSFTNQYQAVQRTASKLGKLIHAGSRLLITHGNGPQVGATLIRHEVANSIIPALPLYVCGAETQGFLGYILQQCIQNELKKNGTERAVVTMVTQVVVDKNDSAFHNPTKPVGPFYTMEQLQGIRRNRPKLAIREEPGKGFRRVVPSPDPQRIVEAVAIQELLGRGTVVIASGGGGIPVIEKEDHSLEGVEAVIDKDLSAERLATSSGARELAIMTDVEGAYLNYGTKTQRLLKHVTAGELRKYLNQGHFASGSMKPKVEAAVRFIEHGGERAVIADLEYMETALEGTYGTQVTV